MSADLAAAARVRVRRFLRRRGFDVVRLSASEIPELRRVELIRRHRISVVLDVGANDGPFARGLREAGYEGRIVSFEPQSDAYGRLAALAAVDPLWECRRVAVGEIDGERSLNIAGNSSSSSFLRMAGQHEMSAPESRYVGTELVEVVRLDAIADEVTRPDDRAYLKLDVQGTELEALQGARSLLDRVHVVDVELSLVPLYEGAPLFADLVGHLEAAGFVLVALEPAFTDPASGQLLQLNGLFARHSPPRSVR